MIVHDLARNWSSAFSGAFRDILVGLALSCDCLVYVNRRGPLHVVDLAKDMDSYPAPLPSSDIQALVTEGCQ